MRTIHTRRVLRARATSRNIAVTLALVLALAGGTAYAAKKVLHHYLIKSTSQIKPSVLATLKGNAGPSGATGPAGATGATGAANPAATSVDGESISKIFFAAPANTGATNIFVGDGLTLMATCGPSARIGLTAASTDDHAELNASGYAGTTSSLPIDDNGFGSATILSATDNNEGSAIITYARPSGQDVTITFGVDYQDAFGSESPSSACALWGTAVESN
jgi:hypothetical protein